MVFALGIHRYLKFKKYCHSYMHPSYFKSTTNNGFPCDFTIVFILDEIWVSLLKTSLNMACTVAAWYKWYKSMYKKID